eukprot:TRINITY_DN781_c0_g1_i1.p1 TRINITY_DN781_c0_g1~~TRINITY_DN781_c0_g1_i1.p1  ORF type:complete len:579 (+),score=196.07 TRINITY_DN781_c0_g1_i1:72-1739(+)
MPFWSSTPKFDKQRTKTALSMAAQRIKLQQGKKTNAIRLQDAELQKLLAEGRYEGARVKVEQAVRDQHMIEALEVLVLFCELLASRLTLLVEARTCPADLREAVSTILWAAPRADGADELLTVREQMALKFGADFVQQQQTNELRWVNNRVYEKLSCQIPEPAVCIAKLERLAVDAGLDWDVARDALQESTIIADPSAPPPQHAAAAQPSAPPPQHGMQQWQAQPQGHPLGHVQPTAPPPAGYSAAQPPMQRAEDIDDMTARLEAMKALPPGVAPPLAPADGLPADSGLSGAAHVSNPYVAPGAPAMQGSPAMQRSPAAVPAAPQGKQAAPLPPPETTVPAAPVAAGAAWPVPAPAAGPSDDDLEARLAALQMPGPTKPHVDPQPAAQPDDLEARLAALKTPAVDSGADAAEDATALALRFAKLQAEIRDAPSAEPSAAAPAAEQGLAAGVDRPASDAPRPVPFQVGKDAAPLPGDPEPAPFRPAPAAPAPLPPIGATVLIHGLTDAPELNGMQGEVKEHTEHTDGSPACVVDLGEDEGEIVCKPDNLEVQEGCA